MLHCQLMAAALFVLPTFLLSLTAAQTGPSRHATNATISSAREAAGIVTSKLSQKDLLRWEMIERIVFAEDPDHQPLHPTLRGMWEWIEASGHTVYIEIVRASRASTGTAGNFSIERHDPKGEHHTGVIKLNLANIDMAYVGPGAARENGFIPFEGLSKEERYAEVLAHELAHAVDILTAPDRARSVEFTIEETNEMLLRSRARRKGETISSDLRGRLSRRDALLQDLEKRAEHMEYVVWKELTRAKALREKSHALTAGR